MVSQNRDRTILQRHTQATKDPRAVMDTDSMTSSMTCQPYDETVYHDIDLSIPQVIEIPTPKLEKATRAKMHATVASAPRRYQKERLATIEEETECIPLFTTSPDNNADKLIASDDILTFLEGFSSLLFSTNSTTVDQTVCKGHAVAPPSLGVPTKEIRLDKLTICRLTHTNQAPSTQKRATHCRSKFVIC